MANLKSGKSKKKARAAKDPRFRYVVKVVETVESLTAVESDRPLPWCKIKEVAERRRIHGGLSFNGVTDVDMWVCEAYRGGVETYTDRRCK